MLSSEAGDKITRNRAAHQVLVERFQMVKYSWQGIENLLGFDDAFMMGGTEMLSDRARCQQIGASL